MRRSLIMLGMIVAAAPAFSLGEPELPGQSDSLPSDIEPPLLSQNLASDDSTLDPRSTSAIETTWRRRANGRQARIAFPCRHHRQSGSGAACAESCASRGNAGRGAAGRCAESRGGNGQTRKRDRRHRGSSSDRVGTMSPRRDRGGLAQPAAAEKAPCLG